MPIAESEESTSLINFTQKMSSHLSSSFSCQLQVKLNSEEHNRLRMYKNGEFKNCMILSSFPPLPPINAD